MRIRFEHNGVVFEYERQPLPAGRFRAICTLVAVGAYMGMAATVAAVCGLPGLAAVGFTTLLVASLR